MKLRDDEYVAEAVTEGFVRAELWDGYLNIPLEWFSWNVSEGDLFKYDPEKKTFRHLVRRQRARQRAVDDLFASLRKPK